MRILVIEDEPRLLRNLAKALREEGYAVDTAEAQTILSRPRSSDEYLEAVATRFGFSDSEFRFFRARFVKDCDNPYDVLRLDPKATNEEIKAQYRELVRNNHPDRLMATGVPAEFIDLATRKLAAINAAYETIAKERGL